MKKAHAALTLIIFVSSLAIAEPINLKQSSFLWRQMADIKEGLRGYQQLFSGKQLDEQQKKAIRNLTIKTGAFIAALASAAGLSYLGYKKLTSPSITTIPLIVRGTPLTLKIPQQLGEESEVRFQDSQCKLHIKMRYFIEEKLNRPEILLRLKSEGNCNNAEIKNTIREVLKNKFEHGRLIFSKKGSPQDPVQTSTGEGW